MLNAICSFVRVFTGVQAHWLGEGPAVRQRIYIANHTSHADCMVLLSALPRSIRKLVRPAAAEDYWTATPLRRWFSQRILNIVPIARDKLTKANNPIKRLVSALDQGSSLIIFPEGGRQDQIEMGDFKCGLYHLCKERPEIELVPTYIDNANRVLPKGKCIPIPVVCSVTFGEPIYLAKGERKEDFLKRAQQAVERCAS
jgi:1-acyl-sn-glycerol-3-phosphate acyltransferase